MEVLKKLVVEPPTSWSIFFLQETYPKRLKSMCEGVSASRDHQAPLPRLTHITLHNTHNVYEWIDKDRYHRMLFDLKNGGNQANEMAPWVKHLPTQV